MSESETLTKALDDVRERLATVQAEYDRLAAELSKLRLAERSLAAIVEGEPLGDVAGFQAAEFPRGGDGQARAGRGRGSRGPRANSAKGRLKTLLAGAGPGGLSAAEIARRLPDVAPNTLNSYLSVLVSSGEAVRRGDFIAANPADLERSGDDQDSADVDSDDESDTDRADAAE